MAQKRVFITGGASGLGKALAEVYASAGAKVCIGDIDQAVGEQTLTSLQQLNPECLFVNCDVTQLEVIEGVRDTLSEKWSGIDVVINNAGVAGNSGNLEKISIEDWEWTLNINVLGVVRGLKVFTPLFKQQKHGHFINIASSAGLMNAPRMSNYSASKAAVISLSETARVELAPYNIGTTVVCPGFFPTNLAKTIRAENKDTRAWVERAMSRSTVSANDIAQEIYQAETTNTFLLLPHTLERRFWRLKRWLPEVFFRQMLKRTAKLFPQD